MHFKCLALLTALCINQTWAALTATDVVNGINNMTELSTDTIDVVKDLDPANLNANGLKAVENFRRIADVANDTAKIIAASDSSPFAKDDQLDLCSAFARFIQVNQELLKALVDQKGVLSTSPLTMPLAAALHFLKGGVDKLGSRIIGLVPTCADEAKKELKELDGTFKRDVYPAYPLKLHLPGVIGVPLGAGVEDQ